MSLFERLSYSIGLAIAIIAVTLLPLIFGLLHASGVLRIGVLQRTEGGLQLSLG